MSNRKFVTETQVYNESKTDVDSNCNDILFFNGTVGTIFVNGFPVASNGTYTINGHEDETNVTKYKISFNGNTGSVYVTRKKYI